MPEKGGRGKPGQWYTSEQGKYQREHERYVSGLRLYIVEQRHRGLNAPPRPTPAPRGGALAKHFDNGSARPISSTSTREPTVTSSRGAA